MTAADPRAVAEHMHRLDKSAAALDIRLVEAGTGEAAVTMTVTDDMANGHGMCHGGVIFTLADTAFQYACNSYDRVTVAAAAQIEFIRAAAPGDQLTAQCHERHRGRAGGAYDVEVTDAAGRTIALFRGRAHEIGGQVVTDGP